MSLPQPVAIVPTSTVTCRPHGRAANSSKGFAPELAPAHSPKPLSPTSGDHTRRPLQVGSSSQRMLKLAIFGFDNTLTETPLHQMLQYKFTTIEQVSHEDLVQIIFGGQERLSHLGSFLLTLKEAGVEVIIVSHGCTSTIREALRRVGFSDHVKSIFGCDSADFKAVDLKKVRLVRRLRDSRKLSADQVIFCDDDEKNIECPIRLGDGEVVVASQICKTLGPQEGLQRGLTETHMSTLLAMVGKSSLSPAPSPRPLSQVLDAHTPRRAQMESSFQAKLKLAIFDFDRTLAEENLYQFLEYQHVNIDQLSQKALLRSLGAKNACAIWVPSCRL